jgi:hypothetical protein
MPASSKVPTPSGIRCVIPEKRVPAGKRPQAVGVLLLLQDNLPPAQRGRASGTNYQVRSPTWE